MAKPFNMAKLRIYEVGVRNILNPKASGVKQANLSVTTPSSFHHQEIKIKSIKISR